MRRALDADADLSLTTVRARHERSWVSLTHLIPSTSRVAGGGCPFPTQHLGQVLNGTNPARPIALYSQQHLFICSSFDPHTSHAPQQSRSKQINAHFTPPAKLAQPASQPVATPPARSFFTMPFLPIGPCCLEGNTLPGEPAGVLEPATDGNPVARYHAKPNDGNVVDSKTALVLFYDAFGLGIVSARAERYGRSIPWRDAVRFTAIMLADRLQPNPKIIADEFAEKLRINVFVPDYIREHDPATATLPHSPDIHLHISRTRPAAQYLVCSSVHRAEGPLSPSY